MVNCKLSDTLDMDDGYATLNLQCRRFDVFDLDPHPGEKRRDVADLGFPCRFLYYGLADGKCGCQEHLIGCAHGDLGKRDTVAMHTFGRGGNHAALININFGAELL